MEKMFAKVSFCVLAFSVLGLADECLQDLKNIAVYEGEKNIVMNLYADPPNVSWKVMPTENATTTRTIVNYDGTRDPELVGLYDVNQTGLVIKDATTTGTPISTAGLYIGQCANNTNMTGAKLLVVRSGPNCNCIQLAAGSFNISCSIVYADHPLYTINQIMSCTANGQVYSATTTMRTLIPSNSTQYVYRSTSTFNFNYGTGPSSFACVMKFGAPSIGPAFLANNAPDFNVGIQVYCGSITMSAARSSATAETAHETTMPLITTNITTRPPLSTEILPPVTTTTQSTTDGLSSGGYIGIGVGIGVGGLLVLGGIGLLFALICTRFQRIDKIKTDDAKTTRTEDDSERGRSHGDNFAVQNYQPLKVPSPQDSNYDQLTTSNNFNVTDQDTYDILYESSDETLEANEAMEGGRIYGDNSAVQNYEPLRVTSPRDSNYDQLTTSTNVNATDQDT